MSAFPQLTDLGYQVVKELGHNRAGGRVTYLAKETKSQQLVVIKQFQFASSDSTWSEYSAHQQEIHLLQQLNHPNIPRYLNSFETTSGFFLVQEYKQAPSLAQVHYWTPEEVKLIAVAVLEVLVYLQQQVPSVIHRDIKPENILVNRQGKLKVYLVDFGFARLGGGEVAVSSVVKGTLGFMPPEQLLNRQLTEASDLYSLGATLICLLTATKSTEIGNLIDEAYRINFKLMVPKLNPQFIKWLEKMVAPSQKNRFNNAASALAVLQPIDVVSNATSLQTLLHKTKDWITAPSGKVAIVGLMALLAASFTLVKQSYTNVATSIKVEPSVKIEPPGDDLRWREHIRAGQPFAVVFDRTREKFDDSVYTGSWETDPMGSLKGGESYIVRYINQRECRENCSFKPYENGFETKGYNQGAKAVSTFSYFNALLDNNEISLWGRVYTFSSKGEVFDHKYGIVGHLALVEKF